MNGAFLDESGRLRLIRLRALAMLLVACVLVEAGTSANAKPVDATKACASLARLDVPATTITSAGVVAAGTFAGPPAPFAGVDIYAFCCRRSVACPPRRRIGRWEPAGRDSRSLCCHARSTRTLHGGDLCSTASSKDFRYAVRRPRQRVASSATVIAILAPGVGATTAIFSVVYGVLL